MSSALAPPAICDGHSAARAELLAIGVERHQLALGTPGLRSLVRDGVGDREAGRIRRLDVQHLRAVGPNAAQRQAGRDAEHRDRQHDGHHHRAVVLRRGWRGHAGPVADLADRLVRPDLAAAFDAAAGLSACRCCRHRRFASGSRSPAAIGTVSQFSWGASGQDQIGSYTHDG